MHVGRSNACERVRETTSFMGRVLLWQKLKRQSENHPIGGRGEANELAEGGGETERKKGKLKMTEK